MAEIAINLKGQDNLTSTVKEAKKAVDELKYSTTELGKASKEFERITNAGKPLKTELRQLKALMAEMNMKGLSNSEEFTRIAAYAGKISNAMKDAGDAVNRFSSDTKNLDAAIQGIQGVAAATSILTGAMGMFGQKNEEVQRMILKVQSALAMLNGVQSIANILNKDSALMQRLKAIRLAATTKVTTANTVATTANTVAEKVNTGAVVTNTAAQKAWNIAKATGKAICGDFTGLLILGVAAMTTYAIATDDAKEEQKELNEKVNEAAEAQKKYKNVAAETYASLMTNYTKLKTEWNNLSNAHDRNQWITNNKSKFEELGVSVKNVADAEKVFSSNTNAVVDGFIKRAKAAARLAELTDLYRKQMELLDKRNETVVAIGANAPKNRTGVIAAAGQPIPEGAGNRSSKYGSINSAGQWVFSEQGAKNWNVGVGDNNAAVKKIDEQIQANNNQITKIVGAIQEDVKGTNIVGSGGKDKTKTTTNKTDKNEIKFSKNSLDDLQKQLDDAKKRLSSGLFKSGETEESLKQLVDKLQKEVDAKRIELGFELSPEAKKAMEEQKENLKKLQEANKELSQIKPYEKQTSSYDKAIEANQQQNGFVTTNAERLDAIREEMDYNDDLILQLKELLQIYQELGNVEGINIINSQLENLSRTQGQLADKATELNQKQIDWNTQQEQIRATSELSTALGDSFSSVGNIFQAVGDESAAAVAEMVASTLQGVADVVPAIMKLIGVKQAEAMASGTASAAELPFPANIAAIAAVVATIISTFASIISAANKFASGGIVGGGSVHGDMLWARVNSGEMILNGKQQKRLFNILDGRVGNGGIGAQQTIEFKIKGADLYGSLKNYSNIKSKVGKGIL